MTKIRSDASVIEVFAHALAAASPSIDAQFSKLEADGIDLETRRQIRDNVVVPTLMAMREGVDIDAAFEAARKVSALAGGVGMGPDSR